MSSVGKPASAAAAVRSFHTDHDENLADLEFTADEIAAGSRNPLLLLSAAARQLNPRQFDLPKDVTCPVNFPGTSRLSCVTVNVFSTVAGCAALVVKCGLVLLMYSLCY